MFNAHTREIDPEEAGTCFPRHPESRPTPSTSQIGKYLPWPHTQLLSDALQQGTGDKTVGFYLLDIIRAISFIEDALRDLTLSYCGEAAIKALSCERLSCWLCFRHGCFSFSMLSKRFSPTAHLPGLRSYSS